MKLVISEKQLKLILSNQVANDLDEQETPVNPEPTAGTSDTQAGGQGYPSVGKWESGATRGPGNQIGVTKWADVVGSTLKRGKSNPLSEQEGYMDYVPTDTSNADPHFRNAVLGIAADFVPVIGPLLSLGIGAYDAKLYYEEGNYRDAAMSAVFSLIPGLQVAKKIPSVTGKALSKIGFENLAKKIISKSTKFTPEEVNVLNFITKYRKEIEAELKNTTQATIKQARQKIQGQMVKSSLKTAGKKLATGGGKFVAQGALGYGAGEVANVYQRKEEEDNLKNLDLKIQQAMAAKSGKR